LEYHFHLASAPVRRSGKIPCIELNSGATVPSISTQQGFASGFRFVPKVETIVARPLELELLYKEKSIPGCACPAVDR
jgi:hypothetical protein